MAILGNKLKSIGAKLTLAMLGVSLGSAGIVGFVSFREQSTASEEAIGAALLQRYAAVSEAMTEQGQRAMATAFPSGPKKLTRPRSSFFSSG